MLRFGRKLLWGLGLLAFTAGASAAELEVDNPRLRLLPGNVPAAGYFSLENTGEEPLVLVGAESEAFEHVMMHRSMEEDGMASMEHVPRLVLKPGEEIEFAPGGYHLMLMGRKQPLSSGDQVTVTLEFEGGQQLPVSFRAVSGAAIHHD